MLKAIRTHAKELGHSNHRLFYAIGFKSEEYTWSEMNGSVSLPMQNMEKYLIKIIVPVGFMNSIYLTNYGCTIVQV